MKIFDAHFHIIDYRFPVYENRGYKPAEFTLDDYLKAVEGRQVVGGALVAGSFHREDYSHIVYALERLGRGFVGVINARQDLSKSLVEELAAKGVRGVRFNLKRCGMDLLNDAEKIADLVWNVAGWHLEFYVENRFLKDIKGFLGNLPKFSIDHLGLTLEGFDDLLELVSAGAKVKATGFGRVDFDPVWAMRQIASVDESALMFGTDLPSTRAPKPFSWDDAELIADAFNEEVAQRIFFLNAQEFYQP